MAKRKKVIHGIICSDHTIVCITDKGEERARTHLEQHPDLQGEKHIHALFEHKHDGISFFTQIFWDPSFSATVHHSTIHELLHGLVQGDQELHEVGIPVV